MVVDFFQSLNRNYTALEVLGFFFVIVNDSIISIFGPLIYLLTLFCGP